MADKIGRDGRVPKRGYLEAAPVHSGMRSRTRDGMTLAGITQTQVFTALEHTGQSHMDPSVPAKRLTPPKAAFGMRSRSGEVSPGDKGHVPDLEALGRAILDSAILSGSTRLKG